MSYLGVAMNHTRLTLDGQPLTPCFLVDGDVLSGIAETAYEQRVVASARAIVAGTSHTTPTPEHLRVLLCWLDGDGRSSTLDEVPF